MFTTAKQVHIYLENAIQSVASNRKQSIRPQFIDMVLNNAVMSYVSSKFPDKTSAKDIESTLKRYTDFRVLKTSFVDFVMKESAIRPQAACKIPNNCLKFQDALCSYIRPFSDDIEYTIDSTKYTMVLEFDESVEIPTSLSVTFDIQDSELNVNTITLDFDDVIVDIKSKSGLFYLYDTFVDRLRNIAELDCKFTTNLADSSKKSISIYLPYGRSIVSFDTSDSDFLNWNPIVEDVVISSDPTDPDVVVRNSSISILSDFEANVVMDDYYGSKNLHLNPIATLSEKGLNIFYTDFYPIRVGINYIRKPRLFNISSGQIPEIEITKEFLDFAVAELLLILNSPSYDRVVNQNVKNL